MGKLSDDVRIIFLDIDGVLNSNRFYVKRHLDGFNPPESRDFTNDVDPFALELFKSLVDEIGAVVVISSTWRIGMTLADIQDTFRRLGATFEVIGKTPILPYSMCRGLEIQEWISQNVESGSQYKNYAIIDDDGDFFIYQAPNFFLTDNYVGITPTTCYKIKRFFGKA